MVLRILFNTKSQKLTSDDAKQMDVVKLVARIYLVTMTCQLHGLYTVCLLYYNYLII